MYSLTLQNAAGDSVITSGDILGRINFAVPSESDGTAATYIASQLYCQAEGSFTSASNPAGLVFSTSASDTAPATGRIRISSDGHFIPLASGTYDLGSPSLPFRNLYVDDGYVAAPTGVFDVISFNVDDESILTKGQISWDDTEGTMDIGLTDNTTIHIGEHRYFRIRNETGDVLYKGQVVYATGVHSNGLITPAKYVADGSVSEVRFMGAVIEDVNNQNNGYVVDFGHLQDIDLDGSASNYAVGDETWVAGDILYVHPTVAGKLTKVEPKHSISVAIVLDPGNGNGNGRMFVRPTSYGHLDDNHDVSVSGATSGQFLQYNSTTDYWVPSSSGNFTTLQVSGSPVLLNIVEDTSPQLGGNLDLDTYSVTGIGGININNDVVASGELKIGGYQPSNLEQPGYLSVGEVRIQQGGGTPVSSYKLYDIVTDSTNHRVGVNMHDGSVYSELAPEHTLDVNGTVSCQAIVAQENGGWDFFGGSWDSSTSRLSIQLDPYVTNDTSKPWPTVNWPGLVIGEGAKTYAPNSMVFATNYFTNKGDAQRVFHVIQYESTDASDHYLSTTKSGTSTYGSSLIVALGTVLTFVLHVAANNDTDDTAAGWIIKGCIKNSTGAPQIVGSLITENFADSSMSSASVSLVPTSFNTNPDVFDQMNIKINGISGKTIRWVCSLDGVVSRF